VLFDCQTAHASVHLMVNKQIEDCVKSSYTDDDDEEGGPVLDRMYILSESRTEVILPATFQAPNLRHLILKLACVPIRSSLLSTTAAGLVTLDLHNIPAFTYFPPSYILTRLSLMLQLEKLSIRLKSPIPNRDVDRQLHRTSEMTTLPSLRKFVFRGRSAYLEGLVARISAPSLSTFRVFLFNRFSFRFSRLLQFTQTSENLTFSAVQVIFGALAVSLHTVPWKWDSSFCCISSANISMGR
jgi:hypothetical protein